MRNGTLTLCSCRLHCHPSVSAAPELAYASDTATRRHSAAKYNAPAHAAYRPLNSKVGKGTPLTKAECWSGTVQQRHRLHTA